MFMNDFILQRKNETFSETNSEKMNPYPGQPKNHQQKNGKVIEIKFSNFTLKLTNLRNLEKQDYAVFLAAVILWTYLAWVAAFIPAVLMLLYSYPPTIFFILLYYIRIYFVNESLDKDIEQSDEKYRNFRKLLETASEYFPIRLIKTADLPADRNYILACYPHGLLPLHTIPNLSTNYNDRDRLFPGISVRVAVHNILLNVPLMRELLINLANACSVSASSLKHILNGKPSKAVVLYPGGISEVNFSGESDTYRIIKSRRKGFIRIALETGASLVPVFNFGETNIYKTYPLRGIGKPTFGLDFVTVRGRGFFQHHFGAIPHNIPINTVVGKPIPVPKVKNPSNELVDEYHKKFFDDLQHLFDEYKHKYDTISGENAKLVMT